MTYNASEVRDWIAHDPSEEDRAELTALLEKAESGDDAAIVELSDRFSGPLQFGTAGLRGAMAAGPFRMNRAVVRRAAAGLVAYLKEKVGDDALLVIGNDARYHSREFAEDTAAIATAAGIRALIMPRELPTPLLAFAVRYLNADAGVMVTASHNPAQDNGYKVYLGGRCADEDGKGVQLVPPADGEIAALIAQALPADEIPLAEGYGTIEESVIDEYVNRTVALIPDSYSRDLKIVYTAMHGVGTPIMRRVLSGAGFKTSLRLPSSARPILTSPPFLSPTRRNWEHSIWPRSWPPTWVRTLSLPPIRTRTAARRRFQTATPGVNFPVTKLARSWASMWPRVLRCWMDIQPSPHPLSPPACWSRSQEHMGWITRLPSPALSGSRVPTASSSATKRPSASASIRRRYVTRTASQQASFWRSLRQSCVTRVPICSANSIACTPATAST